MAHSEQINIRATPEFIETLWNAAGKVGSNVSEFIREAVAARVDSEPVFGDTLASAFTANSEERMVVRAGRGDLDALRGMADAAHSSISAPGVVQPLAYVEAITFAKLAAAHGHRSDLRSLVFLLSQFALFWRNSDLPDLETYYEAQALMLAEALAEEGDEEVSDMVIAAADSIPAAVYRRAQQFQSQLAEDEHAHAGVAK